jgi:predicted metal-dependent phosphoesterase TrpH
MSFVDLHLHTSFSDGTFSPEELVDHARRHNLKAIALTDHDTVEGCARMAVACQNAGIEFIPASELTAEMAGKELHILGYHLDPENPELGRQLSQFQRVRQERIREMVARLNSVGIPLSEDIVFTLADCRAPGRPHLARALVQEGYCATLDEAFERYLKQGLPAWVPKYKISAPDAIALIHQAGGLAVLAHPGLTRADELIPALVAAGLDGLECFHTKHSPTLEKHYLALARTHNLLVTGGSDCHGLNKGRPLIGTVKVPYEHAARLKERSLQRAVERGFKIASAL